MSGKRRVCIVGAGAAGLVALRHVLESEGWEGVAFEESEDVGGIWQADGKTPVYKGLKYNESPKGHHGLPGLPFPKEMGSEDESFVMHFQVLKLLRDFAERFSLKRHVRFSTRVTEIRPVAPVDTEGQRMQWSVAYDAGNSDSGVEIFDAVIVCNGHFSKPWLPPNLDFDNFTGELIYSKDYFVPDPYKGKKVLVFGSGPSGIDITLELVNCESEVSISMKRPPYPGKVPDSVKQMSSIASVEGSVVTFADGKKGNFDVILVCTGYEYSFPFLHADCKVDVVQEKFVTPLYRHLINIHYPSMCFIGLPFRICPFMLFDAQARFFMAHLEGTLAIPSKDEMLNALQDELDLRQKRGAPLSRGHEFDDYQFPYMEALGREAGFSHLLDNLAQTKGIYFAVAKRRKLYPSVYKNDRIICHNDGSFVLQEYSM